MRLDIARLHQNSALVARQRFLTSVQSVENGTAIVERGGIVAAKGKGAIVGSQSLLKAMELAQCIAEIVVGRGVGWVDVHGAANENNSGLPAAELALDHAEHMQRVGIRGFGGQHL